MFIVINEKLNFANWLFKVMNDKKITQAELARRANISRGTISKTLSQISFPSNDVCLAIAKALDLPPEEVFRAAGLLPSEKETTPALEEASHILQQMDEEDQRMAISVIRVIAENKGKYNISP